MNNFIQIFFTMEQANYLVRLLLAHVISDFVFQTKNMAETKRWFSKYMFIHIFIVLVITFGLTFSWKMSMAVAISHWLIDGLKQQFQNNNVNEKYLFFCLDQSLHMLVLIGLWCYKFGLFSVCYETVKTLFINYNFSLLLLGYAIVVWPLGYLIRFALHKMISQENNPNIEHGGRLIGQFERIIILTFVLLGQYEAIGFLITGKSIIRFADRNSEVKSEYVLVGTMMSYSLSIIIGLMIKFLIKGNVL